MKDTDRKCILYQTWIWNRR